VVRRRRRPRQPAAARRLVRARGLGLAHTRAPRLCALGFALLVPVGLILAEFGGTLLPAALRTYLGLRLLRT
jgi:hypothetical protein